MTKLSKVSLFSLLFFGVVACNKDTATPPASADNLAGGTTTIFTTRADAFMLPLANLNAAGLQLHLLADAAFSQQFVTAPAVQFGGLGPIFNQNSCVSCHIRNGRSSPPQFDGDPNSGLLLRLSVAGTDAHGAPLSAPNFGGQLQSKALFGGTAEGQIRYTEQQEIIRFLDGTQAVLYRPSYEIFNTYMTLPTDLMTSPRNAPPVHGLGLLEAIAASDILALEDEFDANGDGISGRANWVWDEVSSSLQIGRFGWKSGQPTALQQSAAAAVNDMGLTNPIFPNEPCQNQSNCQIGAQSNTDINQELLDLFTFYFQTLAVPAPRNIDNKYIQEGKKLFVAAKCATCHTPHFTTSTHSITELENQSIFPYTDLLLHDMGEGLADNRPEFLANGQEWRTPPLWGIGLTQIVNPNARFLHDGRARTLEEAVLWHGGEAEYSKNYYINLNSKQRQQLIDFLNAL